MKRLLLVVTLSMLLAMWILSAWEVAQASIPTPLPTEMKPTATFRFVNLDGRHRVTRPELRRNPAPLEFDRSRLNVDRLEQPAAGTPIFCDPIEQHRLIR